MADPDLRALVRRRLFELRCTVREASRRAAWAVAPETIERLADGRHSGMVSPGLARALSRALDVPENRVLRASGLPEVPDPGIDAPTGPWLRLVASDGRRLPEGR
jgi:hypothetical protein